ncbi:MAG: FAD-dependent oxidoreductase [Clostridia bacterium]|nr:FAD-dependent oxidoreductase [Clostridia bacterium]
MNSPHLPHPSLWSRVELPSRPRLDRSIEADVAVIGAGMCGLLIAHALTRRHRRVVVLEARRMAGGQTSGTTAKITAQHGLIYQRLVRQLGREKAQQYASIQQQAVLDYARLIRELDIDCNFEIRRSGVYVTEDAVRLRREAEAAASLGFSVSLVEHPPLPFATAGAVCFEEQAQFHPLKFLHRLSEGLEIYEHSRVEQVEDERLVVGPHTVTAKTIVFACHYPFVNIPGYYFARLHQERSYVVALQNAGTVDGMYVDGDDKGLSLRSYRDLLLLGGSSHPTGDNSEGGRYRQLREHARRLWPGCREVAAWSAQDCISADGLPFIGLYSAETPNWLVATGFAKWGMTNSMAAARILTGHIVGEEDPNAAVFSPQRFSITELPTMLREGGRALSGLTQELLSLSHGAAEKLPPAHGGVVELEGKTVGLYRSEEGEVFAVDVRCPHLGCQLRWNPDEKSWDCPCHGSRFDYRGRWICGPAESDLLSQGTPR